MKKILAVVAILATFAMLFTGCTGNKADDNVLVMATNATFPPYEFYEGDKIVGIDAEIAEAIAEKLGMELRIDDMEFDSIITAVASGKASMGMAGMTVTEDRLESVDFSTSYATGIQAIIVQTSLLLMTFLRKAQVTTSVFRLTQPVTSMLQATLKIKVLLKSNVSTKALTLLPL